MWSFEHAGIVPDVVCMAKAIANGLPLSALASSKALQERWGRSAHGTTYGGNPVSCAAGLAVLEEIRERDLVANAAARGAELSAGLREIAARDERIGDVRGPGLMIGVEFVKDRATREPDGPTCEAVIQGCADEGLLVLSCGVEHNVIRWIPPLDVTSEEIAEALAIFGRVPDLDALRDAPGGRPGVGSRRAAVRRSSGQAVRRAFRVRNAMTSSSRKRRSPREQTRKNGSSPRSPRRFTVFTWRWSISATSLAVSSGPRSLTAMRRSSPGWIPGRRGRWDGTCAVRVVDERRLGVRGGSGQAVPS